MSTVKWRKRRRLLFIAQQGLCWLCGKRMLLIEDLPPGPIRNPDTATWDHIKPLSLGGDNSQENLALAHSKCNLARANKHEVRAIRFEESHS